VFPAFPTESRGIVTGAAGGIGSAIASALADHGMRHLVLVDRDEDSLRSVAEAVERSSPTCRCEAVCVDLTDPGQVASFVDAGNARWERIDVLVNNAGVLMRRPLDDPRSVDDYLATMRINVDAPFALVNGLLEPLATARGAVLNVASICAERVIGGEGVYAVSKAAIAQLTRSLAVELAPRAIRVNAVAPGIVQTPMTRTTLANPAGLAGFLRRVPMARVATPVEIASACVFLCSSAAAYATGSMLVVDGGFLCS
jgi:NAD(P)-dependent dehydrogenase (short-subunit alcohol dehydrogenase family)